MKKFFILLLVLAMALPIASFADIPEPPAADVTTWVFDYADVLGSSTEAKLDAYIQDLSWLCDVQVIVVTVESLDGADLDDYGHDLFNGWGIHKRDVLILLAPQDGIGIYIGIDAERVFSDDHCLVLIDNHFPLDPKEKDFETALLDLTKHTCLFYAYKASSLFSDPGALEAVAGFDRKALEYSEE